MDKNSRTVLFSISSNALLLTVKLAAGVLTGSASVLSEAVHSATDLVASVVAFVARWLLRVARETDSRALEAEGYNLRTDVWGAAGVAVGLAAALATGWTVLDPIIAAFIGLAILWTAFRLILGSTRVLLDESLPAEELSVVEGVIDGEVKSDPRIRGYHKLRARKSGPQRHIDFHLQLKAETTLGEAHKISDALEERIRRSLPNSDVLIHLEDDRSLRDEDRYRQRPGVPR